MRSARSRNVPNENNWDAESNRKHRDDDFDEKDDENKKYLFGDGKKHRYVRYMLNVPMKLGRMKLILLTLVGFLVLFSVFSGRSESRISTTLGASGNHRRSNHHRANNNNNKGEEDDDEEEEEGNETDDNESLDLSGGDEEEETNAEDNEKEQQTQDDLDSSEQRLEELSVALRKRYAKDINRKGSDLRDNNSNNNIKEQRVKNEKELERAAQSGNDRDIASAMLMKLVLDRADSDREVEVDDGDDDSGKVIKWDAVRAALNARFEAQRQQALARRERERERKKREEARRAKEAAASAAAHKLNKPKPQKPHTQAQIIAAEQKAKEAFEAEQRETERINRQLELEEARAEEVRLEMQKLEAARRCLLYTSPSPRDP